MILWLLPVRLYNILRRRSRFLSVRKSLMLMRSLLLLPVGMISFFY
jgi:hypothetical protein